MQMCNKNVIVFYLLASARRKELVKQLCTYGFCLLLTQTDKEFCAFLHLASIIAG